MSELSHQAQAIWDTYIEGYSEALSNIKKYFAKTIYWTDYSQMSETIPVDGSVEDWDKELNYA